MQRVRLLKRSDGLTRICGSYESSTQLSLSSGPDRKDDWISITTTTTTTLCLVGSGVAGSASLFGRIFSGHGAFNDSGCFVDNLFEVDHQVLKIEDHYFSF